jgi:lipopolysaccharide export system protein LptA
VRRKPLSAPKAVLLTVCLALLGSALVVPRAVRAEGGTVPTRITSDKLRYSPSGQQVVFEGAVRVTREDFVLTADAITVFLGKAAGSSGGKNPQEMDAGRIEKIVANGHVRLERQGRVGTCDTATYLVAQGLFKMEGDPVLTDGKNRLTGEVIKLYAKDNQSEVVGGKNKRVEALFFTPKGAELP